MITISTTALTEACALIVAIGGAITYMMKGIREAKRPIEELQKQLDEHFDMLARDKKRLDDHDKAMDAQGETNRLTLECLLVMLGHLEEGNHSNQMKETRRKVEEFLISK